MSSAAATACLLLLAAPQEKKDPFQAHPKVDQRRVDEAIRKGIAFLKSAGSPGAHQGIANSDELVLWTFVHAGVPETDPRFHQLFRNMMQAPLEKTYKVALQAMILEEMHRVRYQARIQQCAQFLVDNQCKNGQWSYGEPSIYVNDIPVPTGGEGGRDVATGGKGDVRIREYDPSLPVTQRQKPNVVKKVSVKKKKKDGPASGDNSNSQYAALGLRACHDAGVLLPKESIELAAQWWREALHPPDDPAAARRNPLASEGWCYGPRSHGHKGYGSMTAGAVGSLAILDYILEKDWKRDREIQIGLDWLTRFFAVSFNPGPYEHGDGKMDSQHQYYYYMYALERAGVLYGTETFGVHEWYPAGAEQLLKDQRPDGSWANQDGPNPVWDTCFAILFLRRATRPLEDVATRPARKP